jgi:predicted nuclease of predicted toxin-antitoxin system
LKFLIDECLSPVLVDVAVAAGYPESAHVTRRGMAGFKDHRLMQAVVDADWTLVTRNSDDFRPRSGSTSQAPCYVGQPLHAGLVCLNLPSGSSRADQESYFQAALNCIGTLDDLVNQVLEVDPDPANAGQVIPRIYDFPEDAP